MPVSTYLHPRHRVPFRVSGVRCLESGVGNPDLRRRTPDSRPHTPEHSCVIPDLTGDHILKKLAFSMMPALHILACSANPLHLTNEMLIQRLTDIQRQKQSLVCVGLDPDLQKMPQYLVTSSNSPAEAIVSFNHAIIEATAEYACAFKLNFAFFEAYGAAGWEALETTLRMLPNDVVSIADGKRGDIGNSGSFYARSVFETLGFDTCTVAPYMGMDSIQPFLAFPDKLAFVLARTSNPGGADLQELIVGDKPLYERLIEKLADLPEDAGSRVGLVVGATDVAALKRIRSVVPTTPFLIPGVGAQGGRVEDVMHAAYAGPGTVVVNSSRAILYADGTINFAEAARKEAKRLRAAINETVDRR